MVSIRQSHTHADLEDASRFDVDAWLDMLTLEDKDIEALSAAVKWVAALTQDTPQLLKKGCEMVEILSDLSMDSDSLLTALIFPVYQERMVKDEVIQKQFSKEVLLLLDGVDKMDAITTIQSGGDQKSEMHVDKIRRMLMAMVEDVRSIVIKLAERISHLHMIKKDDEEERVLAAKETASVFAPLANRLGIGQLKWELEDLSFRFLHPQQYKAIANMLDDKRSGREKYMADFVQSVKDKLAAEGIQAEVDGRPKHIYSIWKKMDKKNYHFDQLYRYPRGAGDRR